MGDKKMVWSSEKKRYEYKTPKTDKKGHEYTTCHRCHALAYVDTVHVEWCDSCGYFVRYN